LVEIAELVAEEGLVDEWLGEFVFVNGEGNEFVVLVAQTNDLVSQSSQSIEVSIQSVLAYFLVFLQLL
jgi:hypothetical protein